MPSAKLLRTAANIFVKKGGVLRASQATALGIHSRVLQALREQGRVVLVARGIYALSRLQPNTDPKLIELAVREPRAVVGLLSALEIHGILKSKTKRLQLVVPRGKRYPKLSHTPIQCFALAVKDCNKGTERRRVGAVHVSVQTIEKAVVDCFRFRNKIGLTYALQALTCAWKLRRIRPAVLLRHARESRMTRVMAPYLQMLFLKPNMRGGEDKKGRGIEGAGKRLRNRGFCRNMT